MRWNPIEQVQDVVNKFGTEERIKRFQSGELILVERSEAVNRGAILQFKRNVPVVAGRFVTGESFTKSNSKVRFGYLYERLTKFFGAQENVAAGELAAHTLLQDTYDPEIMVALGSQAQRFIKLGQFYQAIEAQGQGQDGPLLVNGRANVAYILDDRGAPWAVRARWDPYGGGWRVHVDSVAGLSGWNASSQVLSQVA